jgi:hypothetical protein
MINEGIDRTRVKHAGISPRHLLTISVALVCALAIYPSKAHAQIVGDLEANIPFQFHVGDTKLPAGKYVIHMLDQTDLTVMEISGADGSTSALFGVRYAEAKSAPAKGELIFNKYGDRYFLARVFDEGSPSGATVDKSRYEKQIGQADAEAQAHVPAHHKAQQGS